ncbi:WD_0853 family protein [Wolbachia endosymbiont of Pentidionis agamae]|uniref:WD_0853 family protein n=1 Tax=Wolbachia endosymbiont of Pentidionis agamae TaxID=3110435 RepID=UPI002FD49ACD
MKNNNYFKGLKHYGLHQDSEGNIKLNSYKDILNARRAKVDMLLDNCDTSNVDFNNLNKALNAKFAENKEIQLSIEREDQEIAEEEQKVFKVLEDLDNLKKIKDQDLIKARELFSELIFLEKNFIDYANKNDEFIELRDLFLEKNSSGKEYSKEEYMSFIETIEQINNEIEYEIESRNLHVDQSSKNSSENSEDNISEIISNYEAKSSDNKNYGEKK